MKTAWIWDIEHDIYGREIFGLNIDRTQKMLYWFQGDFCNICGDDAISIKQEFAEFITHGQPPGIGEIPKNIKDAVHLIIEKLQ